jgi:hypothetical protein
MVSSLSIRSVAYYFKLKEFSDKSDCRDDLCRDDLCREDLRCDDTLSTPRCGTLKIVAGMPAR